MELEYTRIDLGNQVEAVAGMDSLGFWTAYIWVDGEELDEPMPLAAAVVLFPDFDADSNVMPE